MSTLRVDRIAGIGTTTFGPTLEGNLEFNSQNYIVLPKGSSTQEGVLRTTVDVVGTGGTYYDNLVLAMPFNEATGLRDVSSRNRNPAAYGNVTISTAQSKYYGSSAYFDGTDANFIVLPSSIDWTPSSGVGFTIEFWFYPLDTDFRIIQNYNSNNGGWLIGYQDWGNNLNGISIISESTVGGSNLRGIGLLSASYPVNNWYHFAASWSSDNSCRIFINGDLKRTVSNFSSETQFPLYFSRQLDSVNIGTRYYMNDLRIYRGLAKYTSNFTPPERIAEIGVGFKAGQLRYNTDSNKVELYDGNQWTEVQSSRPDLNGGARGVFGGGRAPADSNTIDYITISTTGNATDFGDLTRTMGAGAGCSSNTRGILGGGTLPGGVVGNTIDYITTSSTGNAQDFGDLTQSREGLSSSSSSTRGLFFSGITPSAVNTIDYITIASAGNAQDFGDILTSVYESSSCSSSVRSIIGGGLVGPGAVNTITYVTISSLGNSVDFGDLTTAHRGPASCSNSTRGLFTGGYGPAFQLLTTISYITIASLGNAVNFGERTVAVRLPTGTSSPTRGVFAGGLGATNTNTIDYVTILTQGNAVDFGDLTVARHFGCSSFSNAHGGL